MSNGHLQKASHFITPKECALVLSMYLFMAVVYYLTIIFAAQAWVKPGQDVWSM